MTGCWHDTYMIHIWRGVDMIHIWRGVDMIHIWRGVDMIHIWRGVDMIHIWRGVDMIHICIMPTPLCSVSIVCSGSIVVTTLDSGPGGSWFESRVGANILWGSIDCTGLTRLFFLNTLGISVWTSRPATGCEWHRQIGTVFAGTVIL